jgi:hypothetical protein
MEEAFSQLRPFSALGQSPFASLAIAAAIWRGPERISLAFELAGEVSPLVPSLGGASAWLPKTWRQGPAERRDGLWRTTCWEAFFALPGQDRYWELNFSPVSGWNAYRFERYREGMATEAGALGCDASRGPGSRPGALLWRFDTSLSPELEAALAGNLEVGLAAVVEDAAGSLSYWALAHAGPKPDFHLRASFARALPAAPGGKAARPSGAAKGKTK